MQLSEIELEPETRRKLSRKRGIVVTQVVSGSESQRGGIRSGDVIAEINNREVASLSELRSLLSRQDPLDPLLIFVFSDNIWRFINLSFISGR
ncbi:PDZ domain-containing protein [Geomonas oryzisoli]|uniref:PDZ domain-containing protein n=1 Tax=Geomonas oryzisoli TaxID=2847992 RepID=A0ABX8J872_9BACT|nr:PDZ domain-containing protein [Geomonas oryzisoli]QWV94643.1 PDZ domain-containing protein [Geomonas oryzisoli]